MKDRTPKEPKSVECMGHRYTRAEWFSKPEGERQALLLTERLMGRLTGTFGRIRNAQIARELGVSAPVNSDQVLSWVIKNPKRAEQMSQSWFSQFTINKK